MKPWNVQTTYDRIRKLLRKPDERAQYFWLAQSVNTSTCKCVENPVDMDIDASPRKAKSMTSCGRAPEGTWVNAVVPSALPRPLRRVDTFLYPFKRSALLFISDFFNQSSSRRKRSRWYTQWLSKIRIPQLKETKHSGKHNSKRSQYRHTRTYVRTYAHIRDSFTPSGHPNGSLRLARLSWIIP